MPAAHCHKQQIKCICSSLNTFTSLWTNPNCSLPFSTYSGPKLALKKHELWGNLHSLVSLALPAKLKFCPGELGRPFCSLPEIVLGLQDRYEVMQHLYYVLSSASFAQVGTISMKDHADRHRQLLLKCPQQVLPEEILQCYSHDLAGSVQLSHPEVSSVFYCY